LKASGVLDIASYNTQIFAGTSPTTKPASDGVRLDCHFLDYGVNVIIDRNQLDVTTEGSGLSPVLPWLEKLIKGPVTDGI